MDETLFIADHAMIEGATDLMARFGSDAADHAASLADRSRDAGNVLRFCRWRQIERLILLLDSPDAVGTIH